MSNLIKDATPSSSLDCPVVDGRRELQHLSSRHAFEYAVLPLEGEVTLEGEACAADELAYLGRGRDTLELALPAGARALLLGGEPLGEEVVIWWNFVGHSKAEIAEAQREWETGGERFGSVPEYEGERLMPPPSPWKV